MAASVAPGVLANPVLPAQYGNGRAIHGSADPYITFADGFYYATFTLWNRLEVRRARTLAELAVAQPQKVWPTDQHTVDPETCCAVWAPELHKLDGPDGPRWYLYFSAEREGAFAASGHQLWVLESQSDSPMGPYGNAIKLDTRRPGSMTIDGNVYQAPDGELYLFFSGSPKGFIITENLYVQKLRTPTETEGDPIVIARPTLPREFIGAPIVEAPEVIVRGNTLNVVYSGGMYPLPVGYSLGVLSVPLSSDLMSPATWRSAKSAKPLLTSMPLKGIWSPGHNSFFTSPDGTETWIAYHAYSRPLDGIGQLIEAYSGQGGPTPSDSRTTRVAKLSWDGDRPVIPPPGPITEEFVAPSGDAGRAFQVEDLEIVTSGTGKIESVKDVVYVGDRAQRITGTAPGSTIRLRLPAVPAGTYRIWLRYLADVSQPGFALEVGAGAGKTVAVQPGGPDRRTTSVEVGSVVWDGTQTITLRVNATASDASRPALVLDEVVMVPE